MEHYIVDFYAREDGTKPAEEYLTSLDAKMLAKTLRDIDMLEANGPNLREPQSKALEDGIFELRTKVGSNISRILYFFVIGKRIYLTNGFMKKQSKTPKHELALAKKYREDFIRRLYR